MRALMSLFLLLLGISCYAQEPGPDMPLPKTDQPFIAPKVSDIESISYIPKEGKLAVAASVSTTTAKDKAISNGQTYSDIDRKWTTVNYAARYGFTNSTTFIIRGLWSTRQDEYKYGPATTINGTSEINKSSGLREPELAANFRALNSPSSKIDLYVGLIPKLQTAKYGTTTSNGNMSTGSNVLTIAVDFYKEFQSVQLGFEVFRRIYGKSKMESADDSSRTNETSSFQQTAFDLTLQGRITDEFFIGADGFLLVSEKSDSTSYVSGTVSSNSHASPGLYSGLNVFAKYKVTQSSILKFGLTKTKTIQDTDFSGGTVSLESVSNFTTELGWAQEF